MYHHFFIYSCTFGLFTILDIVTGAAMNIGVVISFPLDIVLEEVLLGRVAAIVFIPLETSILFFIMTIPIYTQINNAL